MPDLLLDHLIGGGQQLFQGWLGRAHLQVTPNAPNDLQAPSSQPIPHAKWGRLFARTFGRTNFRMGMAYRDDVIVDAAANSSAMSSRRIIPTYLREEMSRRLT
jgi:hypothetical protein